MSSSFKLFVYILLISMMTACSLNNTAEPIKANKKAFEQEDLYILTALRMEQLKLFNRSSEIFNTLYERSDKKEYLYRSLHNELAAKKYDELIIRIDEIVQDNLSDYELIRLKIIGLIKLKKVQEAKELALLLVEESKEIDDYLLVSDIYVKEKKFDTALKYLESAYIKDYNEVVLDKMSIILYVNLQRKKDAIAQLETHSRIRGCSVIICKRLISFYSNDNNIDGMLSTYLRLYEIDSSKVISEKITQIYAYKKDYPNMVKFLEKSKANDELLLQLYIQEKNYKIAYPLADDLYKESGDINFLGQSAIFEYESNKDKSSKEMQKSVIYKLKKVLEQNNETIYLNYLGYLLIDHDIDVKKGIVYIKEALKVEPKSIYYLDSLAWGYYKLGNCKRAQKIMRYVAKSKDADNEEVKAHIKTIMKCKVKKKQTKKKVKR